ncbi:HINT domain-containing protein [Streptomyces sp. RS10V-4]|uniref:polymorphic toxin-type HINT domain-containing protein n=1 Tax=Streptomyces rhizoryzae TaxID=2932493 RepID=UPI0020036B8A|nr:polymorphic toxin-type HINT domain-containing protein [Streptomyces rhizoryzae]MCK7625111.1 HINT domain-containing protein [Streptomyces rhizoryzae]
MYGGAPGTGGERGDGQQEPWSGAAPAPYDPWAAPAAGPQAPPAPPAPKSWWRRPPWLLAAGACVLVLALVTGTLLWRAAGPEEDPEGDRAPFYLALYNLAGEPMAHYTGSAPGGTAWDVTVTDGGEARGRLTVDGRQFGVLRVGGKTYAKPPKDLLTDLPGGVAASALEGKWVTGDSRLARHLADVPGSPAELASRLWTGLDRIRTFPQTPAAPVRPGGPMARSVVTPEGRLYVSAAAPYRVLRLEPFGTAGGTAPGGGTAGSGSPVRTAAAALRPAGGAAAALPVAAGTGSGGTDLTPMSADQVGRAYDDLIGQTRTLGGAVDLGIRFSFNQTGNLSCAQSCTVTENVVTSTTAAPGARLSGTVNASMTAQVTVNGESGGGCSATATLPVNGGGTMRCVAAGTAPIVQRIKAQKQREAEAQARATRRPVRIPYTISFRAQVQIMAMAFALAEIEQRVKEQQADRRRAVETAKENAGPSPDCARDSFVAGTPVLTAGSGAAPIERLRAGDGIRNAAPGSGALQRHGVASVIVTDTDRDFVRLTIAGPHGTGTIRATAHHLFYDAAAGSWRQAGALRPGDRLQTTGRGTATVREVRPYRAAARTYNLSVEGVHTYFVLAGDTPVLVHNCAMKRDAKSLKGVRVPRQYEGLDTAHVRSNHFPGGAGVTSRKDLWPAKMTDAQLAAIARQALGNNPRVIGYDPGTGMIQAVATVQGKMVQFQIPRGGGAMRSIYPLVPWSD